MTEDTTTRLDALASGNTNLWDAVAGLREENGRLRERIADLEQVVDPAPGSRDYAQLDRDDKVFRLRKALVTKAAKNGGAAAMDYEAVRSAFDYHPSVGHAYDLMAYAGQADGFDYQDRDGGKRLTVKTDAVNDETLFHAVNKDLAESPA